MKIRSSRVFRGFNLKASCGNTILLRSVFNTSFKLYEDRDLSCFGISTVNMKTSFGCAQTFSTKHGDT